MQNYLKSLGNKANSKFEDSYIIERVIRRLREFSMLQPCANLSSNYIKHLNSMVIIAAALSNLQSPIIKT